MVYMPPETKRQQSEHQPLVVTIGGGTGHFMLLSGLKEKPVRIAAIVSMADDGGSSGMLRDEMGVLPPGDVRQCLAALSYETPVLRELFSYRFPDGPAKGHAFGNLFLSALERVTGSFAEAVREAARILSVAGEIIPVTEEDMRLRINLKDGTHVIGEHLLDNNDHVRTVGVEGIALEHPVAADPTAIKRILEADFVVIGPGDLYGSVLPPLLIPAIARALRETKAHMIYVANLTNKRGQTEGFHARDYVRVLHHYIGSHVVDTVVCNSEKPPLHLAARYEEKEGKGMFVVCERDAHDPYECVEKNILSSDAHMVHHFESQGSTRSFIRHDPTRLASVLMDIIERYHPHSAIQGQ